MRQIRTWKVGPNPPDTQSGWIYKGTARYFNNGKWEILGTFDLMNPIANLPANAELEDVIKTVNSLIQNLKEAGIMKS